jgi:hypothetical protein
VALGAGGVDTALWMLAVVLVTQNIIEGLVRPLAFGAALDMHPLAILAATVAGGILGGVVGGSSHRHSPRSSFRGCGRSRLSGRTLSLGRRSHTAAGSPSNDRVAINPVPWTASAGARTPHLLHSRIRSAHRAVDLRSPSTTATSRHATHLCRMMRHRGPAERLLPQTTPHSPPFG